MKRLVAMLFILLLVPLGAAGRLAKFPGLDAAIKQADAIVVVSVVSNVNLSAWGRTIGEAPYGVR